MRVITIYLMGGLGNNLFQYNYGEYLRNEWGVFVKYNNYLCMNNIVTRIKGFTLHDWVLPRLLNEQDFLNEFHYSIFFGGLKLNCFDASWMKTCEFPKANHLFGYFQDLKFHKNNIHISLDPYILEKYTQPVDWVVHLRFGDANNRMQNIKYYTEVLQSIGPYKNILVVTDDKLKSSALVGQFTSNFVVQRQSVLDDFFTLAAAKSLAVAPSTYSWWASRLGRADKIIYPEIYK